VRSARSACAWPRARSSADSGRQGASERSRRRSRIVLVSSTHEDAR